jgi:hypothetical protein
MNAASRENDDNPCSLEWCADDVRCVVEVRTIQMGA